jgi:hypothetical protein
LTATLILLDLQPDLTGGICDERQSSQFDIKAGYSK